MKKVINILVVLIFVSICFTNSIAQTQIGQTILGESEDFSASEMALSADGYRVAISAFGNDGNGNNSGAVRVFDLVNGIWTQVGSNINGEQAEDFASLAISLSAEGHRLAIGSPASEDGGGHVRIFELIDGEWTQIGQKIIGETYEGLGHAVALSADGNKIAISAPFYYAQTGRVSVFELVNEEWTKLGEDMVGSDLLRYFGETLSFSANGNRLLVGEKVFPMNKTGITAYEFINGNWSQLGNEIENQSESENYTINAKSISLSADGTRAALGSPNSSAPGYAAVYEFDGSKWGQIGANIYIEGQELENTFGNSIVISPDGNRIAVSARVTLNYPGTIRIYELIDDNWVTIGDEISGEPYCCSRNLSLSADGNTLAIGEHYFNNIGRARIFDLRNATVSIQQVSSSQLKIFPNPTNGRIDIQSSMEYKSLQILDQYGRVVMMIDEYQTHIDLSHLTSGIYFIQLWNQEQFISQRLVKI